MKLDCTNISRPDGTTERLLKVARLDLNVTLKRTRRDVSSLQEETTGAMLRMENGDRGNLKRVFMAVEKARTSFDLLMGTHQRAVGTYREIMRNAESN